jgi:hypothetical protein
VNAARRLIASRLLAAASHLLPPDLARWYRAMAREVAEIPDDGAAASFAAGCLRVVLAVAVAARVRAVRAAVRDLLVPVPPSPWSPPMTTGITARPRLLGLLCGALAVGMGMAYMLAAGAPPRYLIVNLAALILGGALWLALARTADTPPAKAGLASLALAAALLLTALSGLALEGASRWVSVGPLNVQVSLIAVPLMLVLYARRPDAVGTAAIVAAAAALALQPDRAMAGVLAAGLVALVAAQPARLALIAAAASALAFVSTLLTPDTLPAVPFVDRILYTAFDVHLLAGVAVLTGAAALVAPAVIGVASGADERPALFAFAACWSAVIAAAALGNSPTPLVGYGGSAVLGYLLSVALLPGGARASRRGGAPAARSDAGHGTGHPVSKLQAARPI